MMIKKRQLMNLASIAKASMPFPRGTRRFIGRPNIALYLTPGQFRSLLNTGVITVTGSMVRATKCKYVDKYKEGLLRPSYFIMYISNIKNDSQEYVFDSLTREHPTAELFAIDDAKLKIYPGFGSYEAKLIKKLGLYLEDVALYLPDDITTQTAITIDSNSLF